MPKIALSMIVKGSGNEPQHLERCLASVAPHVDAIFITLTGPPDTLKPVVQICEKYHAQVSYHRALWTVTQEEVDMLTTFFGYPPQSKVGDAVFLFDEARNFAMSQIDQKEYPWIIWLDCDDVLRKGQNVRKLVEAGDKLGIDAWYFQYLYQVEMKGEEITHILIQHLRERLIRNIGVYKWIAPIHETLIEQRPTKKTDTDACEVLHLPEDQERLQSLQRNLKSLELAIYQSKGEDPRHIYYLAKAFYDLHTPEYDDKAIQLILIHYVGGDHQSGWPEERAQSYEYLAELYRRQNNPDKAVRCGLTALMEDPENPSLFLSVATSYAFKGDWERALFWTKLAIAVPGKKTTLVSNPKDVQARTLELIFNCCLNLSKVDEAWAAMVKLRELYPEDASIHQKMLQMQDLRLKRDLTRDFAVIADTLQKTGEIRKIQSLVDAAPNAIKDNPYIIELMLKNKPPTPWGKQSMVFYCGQGFTPWSPKKLTDPGQCFVGGSEEAVCYLAPALVKQGWEVTVYGDPGEDAGVIDGVTWLPYYQFNPRDHFNVLVSWRQLGFFDQTLDAKTKVLWLHDIANPLEYTKERIDKIDKVIFLSKWHRENVPDLPESKVMYSSNGVTL